MKEASISLEIFRNFWLPKLENCGCVIRNFPYCENRTTGMEKRLYNYDFHTLITRISSEVDTSIYYAII